jgi:cell division protein FtsI (penicillin-binding protein 3)
MEVSTGRILGISNLGYKEGTCQEDYNYAVGSATEPGSTMKLATVMAFFEDNLADLDTRVNLNKGYKRFFNRDLKDSEFHGLEETDLRKAFEISSNVGIATLTYELYGQGRMAEQFVARLKQFGLYDKTGIGIPGEAKPLIKDAFSAEQNWSGTTLPWMSIGYECRLTPLQMLTFYNAVANDGRLMKPMLVDAISEDGRIVKRFRPQAIKDKIASAKTIDKAQELLEGVALRGTASKVASPIVTFAGKTGTARIDYYLPDDGRKNYQSSFVGYFPAEKPRYSCIVLINDPKDGKYYGSMVALPVFLEIAQQCMALEPVRFDPEGIRDTSFVHQLPEGIAMSSEDAKRLARAFHWNRRNLPDEGWIVRDDTGDGFDEHIDEEGVLPDVRGMSARDAVYLLENQGLKVRVNGIGLVRRQSVTPGTRVSKGMHIELSLDT